RAAWCGADSAEARVDRRDFLKTTATGGVLAMVTSLSATQQRPASPTNDREYWLSVVRRLTEPVLGRLAEGTLKASMPVEQAAGADRRSVTHLEALGRLLAGIAPWLELPVD